MKTQLLITLSVVLGVSLALVCILAAQGSALAKGDQVAQATSSPFTLNLNLGGEPITLDPAKAQDGRSIDVIEQLFIGLVDLDDETGAVEPELATSWSVSPDGIVYTFTLRSDVFWTDGNPVTAQDVRYGILRSLDPATEPGYYSSVLAPFIENGRDYYYGVLTDTGQVGVTALDNTHLCITMARPAAHALSILSMWVARPMPQWAIEAHGVPTWTEAANIVTNGPYRLSEWFHDDLIILDRNPTYYDVADVQIEQVRMWMVDGSTAWQMYLHGQLDTAAVPEGTSLNPGMSQEVRLVSDLASFYNGFSVIKPPFDDPLVRKAFVAATDRAGLVNDVRGGNGFPALTFTPPGIFGHVDGEVEGVGIPYDPTQAQQWLTDAGYPGGVGLPPITYTTYSSFETEAEFLLNNWFTNLAVSVTLRVMPFTEFLNQCSDGQCQIWPLGWGPDYNDAYSYLYDAVIPDRHRYGNWTNASYEDLLSQATLEQDPGARKDLYRQAEEILVESDAVMMPLYWRAFPVAAKPYLERTYAGWVFDIATWRNAHLVSGEIGIEGGSLTSYDGNTMLGIPPGAFTDTVILKQAPVSGMPPEENLAGIGHAFNVTAVYSDTGQSAQVVSGLTLTITVHYTDTEVGLVNEDTLALYYWDSDLWVEESSSAVNSADNTLTATPDHLSLWAVLGKRIYRVFLPVVLSDY